MDLDLHLEIEEALINSPLTTNPTLHRKDLYYFNDHRKAPKVFHAEQVSPPIISNWFKFVDIETFEENFQNPLANNCSFEEPLGTIFPFDVEGLNAPTHSKETII